VTTAWLLPWYIVWVLTPAALARRRLLPAASVVLTVLLLGMQIDHFVLTRHSHHRHRSHIAHIHKARVASRTWHRRANAHVHR
jgi:hypothetical protein